MWGQIEAIWWAQFRTMRNHLPRTSVGGVLLWLLSMLWYCLFVAGGIAAAVVIPQASITELRDFLPAGLFGVFVFWQVIPLLTLSSGWSLQTNKLQIYPVSDAALFGIEVFLRFTAAPEMIAVLVGTIIGLFRHPDIAWWSPPLLLLFVPVNLFLSLGIREAILHTFSRSRFREIFVILIVAISVTPQILLRTSWGVRVVPYLLQIIHSRFTPWQQTALLGVGQFSAANFTLMLAWIAACWWFARRQFKKSLSTDDTFKATPKSEKQQLTARAGFVQNLLELPGLLLGDPLGALVQKEIRSLLRMPRFRVTFGMACVFSVIVFVPMALDMNRRGGNSFIRDNFLAVVTLYGLLLISDTLMLNAFGTDRSAAQLYFLAPVPFRTVLRAKNIVASVFIILQASVVLIIAEVARLAVGPTNIINALGAAAVVGIFFVALGNMSSVSMARAVDPAQTFKKQAGGRMQLWLLACSVGMYLLVGFAFLARWALRANWAIWGTLLFEFVVGLIVYRVATDSAVERALRNREKMLSALSKGTSPIGLGLS